MDVQFRLPGPLDIPRERVTPLGLHPDEETPGIRVDGAEISVLERGWYEVHLTVAWDPAIVDGTRFSHTRIPDGHPLHSEAIDASVLARISGGRQLLRGNAIFGDGETDSMKLEVWHDAAAPVTITEASLRLRRLELDDARRR